MDLTLLVYQVLTKDPKPKANKRKVISMYKSFMHSKLALRQTEREKKYSSI
jgi:hypothetical protein